MMHPATRVRPIDDTIGIGVVATEFIAKGTIVYARDALDIVLPPGHPLITDSFYRENVERYSYLEADGTRVICWDCGKYVNHACDPSTLTTGYGFEIAVRDLEPGDEITDDYGLLNCLEPMALACAEPDCRRMLRPDDFERLVDAWDERIMDSLRNVPNVPQPLESLIDPPIWRAVTTWLRTGRGYWSVARTRFRPDDGAMIA